MIHVQAELENVTEKTPSGAETISCNSADVLHVSGVTYLFTSMHVKPSTHRRRDSTVDIVSTSLNRSANSEQSCVMSAVWTHQSAVVTQFTISCVVAAQFLATNSAQLISAQD